MKTLILMIAVLIWSIFYFVEYKKKKAQKNVSLSDKIFLIIAIIFDLGIALILASVLLI